MLTGLSDAHISLLGSALEIAIIFANIGVIVGVAMEREHYSKTTQDRGWRLLLLSLALEACLGILLYVTDSLQTKRLNVSLVAQETRNLLLERELAPRNININKVKQKTFEEMLKFSGKTVKIASFSGDPEAASFSTQLIMGFSPTFKIEDSRLSVLPIRGIAFGVFLSAKDPDFLVALTDFFGDSDIKDSLDIQKAQHAIVVSSLDIGDADAYIFVALKPLPAIILK